MRKQCTIYKLDTQKGLEQISVQYRFAQLTECYLSPLLAYYLTIKVLAYYLTIKVNLVSAETLGWSYRCLPLKYILAKFAKSPAESSA